MTVAKTAGARGERLAQLYLEGLGYQTVAVNWRCKAGEIDLVMDDPKDGCRVLVEVRLRAPTTFGSGEETVAREKQRTLIRAAKIYQQKENFWGFMRFDVVAVTADRRVKIEHIEDAFME